MKKQWIFLLILVLIVSLPYMMLPKGYKHYQHFEYTSDKNDSMQMEKLIKEYKRKAQQDDLNQYLKVI